MNIPMPDQREKEVAIQRIITEGLVPPQSLRQHVGELYCSLGFRYIFRDTVDGLIMAVAAVIGFMLVWTLSSGQHLYGMVIIVSPLLFLLQAVVIEAKERLSGMYELKMVCKFTLRQITAFRMIGFSGLGIVCCIGISVFASFYWRIPDFGRILVLSLCSLFLYSLFTLWGIQRMRGRAAYCTPAVMWIIACLLPVVLQDGQWDRLLADVPVAAALCLLLVSGWLYLREIKKLFLSNDKEVLIC